MRTLLVLAALGWIISLPWATLFAYFALIVIAIVVMWFPSISIERRAVARCAGGNTIDHPYVAALESMVAEAETQVEALRAEVEQLRAAANRKSPDADASKAAALHGRVGLCEHAPEWLVAAAQEEFILAARTRGEGLGWILFREILPNALPPLVVETSLRISFAILLGAVFSFLGLGTQPPSSDWGLMIAEARPYLEQAPWIALAPGVALCVTVISINLVGEGLRQFLDVRSQPGA